MRWGDGFPCFGVAPQIGVMDSDASVWPLEVGLWTPTLQCGPWSWSDGLPCFGVAPQVGMLNSHASGGPSSWGNPYPPQKLRKVHTWAESCVLTTTCTTRFGHVKRPPSPKDGGIFPTGIQPHRIDSQCMTPLLNAILQAQVYLLGWMIATFLPTKWWFGAWERSLSQALGQGPRVVCPPQAAGGQL